jgi:hypothetical protein
MNFSRDFWRRGPVYRYFMGMDPLDRATAIIVLALLAAWAVAFSGIVRSWSPPLSSEPAFLPTPFELRFAVGRAGS